jgi:hypothetical protein
MALHDIYFLSALSSFAVAPPFIDILFDPDLTTALSPSEPAHLVANQKLRLGPPIKAILDPILVLIGAAVVGLSWGIWRHKRKQREAVLDSAWREVLADPHYLERRHLEERRLVAKGHDHEAR